MEQPQIILQRAVEAFQSGNFQSAKNFLEQAIPAVPELPALRYLQALNFLQLREIREALGALTKLLEIVPGHSEGRELYRQLSGDHWRQPLSPSDTEDAKNAIRFRDWSAELLCAGFPLRSLVCADKALSYKLTLPDLHRARAKCLSQLGRHLEALDSLRREQLLFPEDERLQAEIRDLEHSQPLRQEEQAVAGRPVFIGGPVRR